MQKVELEFQVKRGLIDDESIEDRETLRIVEECKKLCADGKHNEAATMLLPVVTFEWDWNNGDADASEYFQEPELLEIQCDNKNCTLRAGLSDDKLMITATIKFSVNMRQDVDISADELKEWFDDNSMYACGFFNGGWSYFETDGDNVSVTHIDGKSIL